MSFVTTSEVLHRVWLTYLEAPTPLDRGDISGDLTNFSFTNGALRAVKVTEECDESHVNLTQYCGKSSLQRA